MFLVHGQAVEILAPGEWRRVAAAPIPAAPAEPVREPRLIPATDIPRF